MAQSAQYLQGCNLLLDDLNEGDPAQIGHMKYDGGRFRQRDSVGVYDPRFVWQVPHDTADSLSHLIDDWVGGGATVVVAGSPFVTSKSYYADAAQTKLLATVTYNRNANQACTSKVTRVYAADGVTVAGTSTDTYNLNTAGFPTGFVRT